MYCRNRYCVCVLCTSTVISGYWKEVKDILELTLTKFRKIQFWWRVSSCDPQTAGGQRQQQHETWYLSAQQPTSQSGASVNQWEVNNWSLNFFFFFCGFRGENLRTRGTGGDQLLKGRSLNTSELTQLFLCASEWVMGSNRWLLIHITGVALFHTSTPPQLTRDSLLFFIFFSNKENLPSGNVPSQSGYDVDALRFQSLQIFFF